MRKNAKNNELVSLFKNVFKFHNSKKMHNCLPWFVIPLTIFGNFKVFGVLQIHLKKILRFANKTRKVRR